MKSKTIHAILKLVIAEFRGSWQRLSFFIICIAIGVGAVMSVKSLSANIADLVQRESKSLIASDLEIKGSWPLTNEESRFVEQIAEGQVLVQIVMELKAMALIDTANDRPPSSISSISSMLVELKAVPANYPFYGNVVVSPKTPFQELLLNNSALVEESFLLTNNLQTGDYFHLGKTRLRIRGVIKREPDRVINFFNIGPRVMISVKTLEKTGLIQPGSRVRYRTQIKIPDNIDLEPLVIKIKKSLAGSGMTVQSYLQAQPALMKSIKRFEWFLGSVGVISLLVGGVGVAMIAHTFLQFKLTNIAILKCLGGQTKQIFSVYVILTLLLGLMGSLLGITGGFYLQWLISAGISQYFNVSISPKWIWMPALETLILGMITTFIFTLWPLLNARRTPPAKLLRPYINDKVSQGRPNLRNLKTFYLDRLLAIMGLALGLIIITFGQAGSLRAGAVFFSGVVGVISILIFITWGILKLLKKLPKPKNIIKRYGISNLYRPHSQAVPIVTALGVGVMLILTVHLIQSDMLDFIHKSAPANAPNFFFIDLQPDQVKPFKKAVKKISSARITDLVPIIRSRLHAVAGKPVSEMKFESARIKRFFHREFVLTYTDTLPKENTIIKGKWWGKSFENFPRVSVEEQAAVTLGVTLGSQLTLNIQGVLVTATVASLRKVNWNNRRTNFYMILSPESLEGVSYNYVATAQVPEEDELELQNIVVQSLPNVTAINTRQILLRVQEVLDRLSFLVRLLSVFTIATGLIILSGAIASTKFRRMREAAILKTIGATKKTIAGVLGYEYFLLGLISGCVGSLLSILFSYGIGEHLIRLDWSFRPVPIIIAVMVTVFLVWTIGLLSSWNILNNKPLRTLSTS